MVLVWLKFLLTELGANLQKSFNLQFRNFEEKSSLKDFQITQIKSWWRFDLTFKVCETWLVKFSFVFSSFQEDLRVASVKLYFFKVHQVKMKSFVVSLPLNVPANSFEVTWRTKSENRWIIYFTSFKIFAVNSFITSSVTKSSQLRKSVSTLSASIP